MKKLLEIKNLSITYDNGKNFILKDFNFDVFEGEIISIIGKNGAGKSSLLKTIFGIKKIFSGTIKKYTEKISYVPQKLELDKSFPLTCEEFVKIYNKNVADEDIKKFFEMFSLQGFEEKNINLLSGGEFQKILIINSIISKPDLVLLDEPTAGIDVIGEDIFYKNIFEIKKNFPKISVLIVSHNLNLVYKYSDRIICLHENNFCCHASSKDLLKDSKIQEIFGEYLTTYTHNPHEKHNH